MRSVLARWSKLIYVAGCPSWVIIDEDLIESILAEAEVLLGEFVTADGATTFDAPAHIVTAHT